MNTRAESGVSCEIDGDINSKLPAPLIPSVATYSGSDVFPIWDSVKTLLKAPADWSRGEYDVDDLFTMLVNERMRLWVFSEASEIILVMVTEVVQYPRKKVCNIYSISGRKLAEMWYLFFPYGRTWMEMNQITEIQTTCRDEIAAKIIPFGFVKTANVLRYDWKEIA